MLREYFETNSVSNFIKIKKIHALSKMFDTYLKCFDRTSPKKVYNLLSFAYSIYINKIQLLMLLRNDIHIPYMYMHIKCTFTHALKIFIKKYKWNGFKNFNVQSVHINISNEI